MSDVIYRGCFPIEVRYENERYPVVVEKLEDLEDRPFSVCRTRVPLTKPAA